MSVKLGGILMARAKKPAKVDKYSKVQPKVHPYTMVLLDSLL